MLIIHVYRNGRWAWICQWVAFQSIPASRIHVRESIFVIFKRRERKSHTKYYIEPTETLVSIDSIFLCAMYRLVDIMFWGEIHRRFNAAIGLHNAMQANDKTKSHLSALRSIRWGHTSYEKIRIYLYYIYFSNILCSQLSYNSNWH